MAREHVRGRNWTFEEDVSLCLAWVSISEDGAVGTNQNKKVLWDKIIAKFQENCNGSGRDGGGVYDRWKTINKACTLWKGSLERAMVGMPSGRSAIEITRVTPKNQVFKLQHAWDVLKDCPRWATDADQQWGRLFQREAAPRNEGGDEGVDEMTPSPSLARPPGRDKQKEAKRKGKSQDSPSGDFAIGIAKLHETHSARQEEAARLHLQMKEISDREENRFEIEFMMKDLSKYTPERKQFLRNKQKEIMRKSASRRMFQDDESSKPYIPTFQRSPSPSEDGGYDC
ncbi:uncharacterized protein [Malus domestica]|uniref:uncharacterized protein n=1 Tax=Malus domestica TaxID=3750 RepID=UPI00397611BE